MNPSKVTLSFVIRELFRMAEAANLIRLAKITTILVVITSILLVPALRYQSMCLRQSRLEAVASEEGWSDVLQEAYWERLERQKNGFQEISFVARWVESQRMTEDGRTVRLIAFGGIALVWAISVGLAIGAWLEVCRRVRKT